MTEQFVLDEKEVSNYKNLNALNRNRIVKDAKNDLLQNYKNPGDIL